MKPRPERSDEQQLVAGPELTQSLGTRADVLEQELQLAAPSRGRCDPQDAERARQERPLAISPTPPLAGGEHVELARARARARRVGAAEHDVGAVLLTRRSTGATRRRTAR